MGQTKTFHVFDQGKHEYTIVDKETAKGKKLSLFYSESESWSEHTRGKLALKLKDNGNGIKFNKKFKGLDYGKLAEMRLLMNYARETETHPHDRAKLQVYETTQDGVTTDPINL